MIALHPCDYPFGCTEEATWRCWCEARDEQGAVTCAEWGDVRCCDLHKAELDEHLATMVEVAKLSGVKNPKMKLRPWSQP